MNIINKYINIVTEKIGNRYISVVLRNEYENQKYIGFNERPVEYSFVFKQLTKYCPKTILDIGTGITALPQLMKTCGFIVTAIDNVRDYWPKGMSNRHYYILDDNIINSKLDLQYELVTCISTLEHIVDYNAAIKNMFALLKPKGKLVLTFPYNESAYCENVYKLKDSKASPMPFITQSFSRKQLLDWCLKYNAEIVEEELWQYFTGEYWSTGEKLLFPKKAEKHEKHQMGCFLLVKI